MKNGIEAMITDITATTAEAGPHRRGRAFYIMVSTIRLKSLFCRGKDLFSGVTATGRVRLPAGSP